LTPVVSIMVWFDMKLSTSSIFLDSVSHTAELVYEGSLTAQSATYDKEGNGVIGTQIQPKRGYLSTAGFYYESQAPISPYSLIEAARNDIPPQIKFSAATWMYELTAVFPSASDAINSWAYLRQKVIPNIKQDVDMVNDTTIKIRFGFDSVTYMKWMMAGETDAAKVKNAIIFELKSLAVPPIRCSDFVMGNLAVMDSGHCHLYVIGTDIGLTCDTNDVVIYGNDDSDQTWVFVAAGNGLYKIQTTVSQKTVYLVVKGDAYDGSSLTYSKTATTWAVKYDDGGLRIIVPDTDLNIQNGQKTNDDAWNVFLAPQAPNPNQIWTYKSAEVLVQATDQ